MPRKPRPNLSHPGVQLDPSLTRRAADAYGEAPPQS